MKMRLPKELNELKSMNNWACYRLNDDKVVFIDPETGEEIMNNKAENLLSYEDAIKVADKYEFDGIGFKFSSDYGCIELRNVCPRLRMLKMASDVIKLMDSYTEWTPMRDGVTIIYKASLVKNMCLSPTYDSYFVEEIKQKQANEIIPITGNSYGDILEINKRDDRLEYIRDCLMFSDTTVVKENLYRSVYDDIAKYFLEICSLEQVLIDLGDKGLLLGAPYLFPNEESSVKELLTRPRIHAAVLVRLALKDQRLYNFALYTLQDVCAELWERGLPCSFEDAALTIVKGIDLSQIPKVASKKDILIKFMRMLRGERGEKSEDLLDMMSKSRSKIIE